LKVSQTSADQHQTETRKCQNCENILPAGAQFCASCGKRVEDIHKQAQLSHESDISERYRITSLIRRRSYVQLLQANDTHYQRPVMIRDIDVTSLDEWQQQLAIDAVQQEYDQLRRLRISDIMLQVDLRRYAGHLYTIAEWPGTPSETAIKRHIYTLEDLLQSGIGLPSESITTLWIERLAQAIARLHNQQIVIGELDPYTIAVSDDNYDAIPLLTIGWLPARVQELFAPVTPATSDTTNSPFCAPEASQGHAELRSDIYSLGAICYLLLTGIAPAQVGKGKKQRRKEPRELLNQASSGLKEIMYKALEQDPTQRFASAQELAEALRNLTTTNTTAPPTTPFALKNRTRSLGANTSRGKRDEQTPPKPASVAPKLPSPYTTKVLHPADVVSPEPPAPTQQPSQEQAQQPGSENEGKRQQPQIPSADVDGTPVPVDEIKTVIIDAGAFESYLVDARSAMDAQKADPDSSAQPTSEPSVRPAQNSSEDTEQVAHDSNNEEQAQQPFAIEDMPTRNIANSTIIDQDQEAQSPEAAGPNQLTKEEPAAMQRKQHSNAPTTKTPTPPDTEQDNTATPTEQTGTEESEPGNQLIPSGPRERRLPAIVGAHGEEHFLQRLRRLIMGQQQHTTGAAALIETPLRVQPNQTYVLRIQIMGRNETDQPGVGLSGRTQGDKVRIEVRSALYNNYAYIVQKADVEIPAQGFAASITIPMQPLSKELTGRRERLNIFFMDEQRTALYERPFAIEVFISPLVQAGREGHSVLPIPI
jgi:serine/threonine protein kinase